MIEGERRDAINRAIDVLIENTSLNENSKPDEIRSVLKEQNHLFWNISESWQRMFPINY